MSYERSDLTGKKFVAMSRLLATGSSYDNLNELGKISRSLSLSLWQEPG
jgi:hypothetical protein